MSVQRRGLPTEVQGLASRAASLGVGVGGSLRCWEAASPWSVRTAAPRGRPGTPAPAPASALSLTSQVPGHICHPSGLRLPPPKRQTMWAQGRRLVKWTGSAWLCTVLAFSGEAQWWHRPLPTQPLQGLPGWGRAQDALSSLIAEPASWPGGQPASPFFSSHSRPPAQRLGTED